jgi:hypothetical protein
MNMAFGQMISAIRLAWGVAPGYGEKRPLANVPKLLLNHSLVYIHASANSIDP